MKNSNESWINLLTRGNRQIFDDVRASSKCETLAIMKLRRMELEVGIGQDITSEDLQDCNCREESSLQEMLQNLFLEPVLMNHIEFLYKQIVKRGYSIEEGLDKVYQRHIEDRGVRLLSIALTL